MAMRRRSKCECNDPELFQILSEIKIDIATIKNELKWHRYLIMVILSSLLAIMAKLLVGF